MILEKTLTETTAGHPSANTQGTMTSVYNLGCFAGALSTIFTGDWLGRPRQILLGSTIIAIGAVIQTASWGVPQVRLERFPETTSLMR